MPLHFSSDGRLTACGQRISGAIRYCLRIYSMTTEPVAQRCPTCDAAAQKAGTR